jgi:hypothetical protein
MRKRTIVITSTGLLLAFVVALAVAVVSVIIEAISLG